jgi:hypothetical protein
MQWDARGRKGGGRKRFGKGAKPALGTVAGGVGREERVK